MSKLMLIFGILFLAAGVALGLLILFQPGQMQVLALTPEVAAIFLVGGALCLGLGNLAGALQEGSKGGVAIAVEPEAAVTGFAGSTPATPKFKGFGSKTAAVVAEAKEEVFASVAAAKTSVAETISALEQAKSDIAIALGVESHVAETAAPAPVEVKASVSEMAIAEETAAEEPELFVVEEKVIKGRPARVLSDGTVEAETDEGWMRFENLEHLDEYLEAMVPET
jgi:hypothetical protein